MALDNAGITLADRCAGDIHQLADLEDVHADLPAKLEIGELIGLDAKFLQNVTSLDAGLGKMPGSGLVDATGAALAKCHLDRGYSRRCPAS